MYENTEGIQLSSDWNEESDLGDNSQSYEEEKRIRETESHAENLQISELNEKEKQDIIRTDSVHLGIKGLLKKAQRNNTQKYDVVK